MENESFAGEGARNAGNITDGPDARDIEVAGSLRTVLHRLIKLLRRETRNEAQLSLTERAIHRSPSADDKRKVLLSLTPAGRADVEQRRLDKQEWLARALHEKVSPEERELLMEAIMVLTKLIDE